MDNQKITKTDIIMWQESMYKCADCIANINELYSDDVTKTASAAALKVAVRNILHDMAFMVMYIDSTLSVDYEDEVSLAAKALQQMIKDRIEK